MIVLCVFTTNTENIFVVSYLLARHLFYNNLTYTFWSSTLTLFVITLKLIISFIVITAEILTEPNTNEYIDDDSMEHPILRHHIAHFCPNLDLARVCIRKCMNVGKPAFCGKDHVCYCGHKYEVPGAVSNLTAADTHNQFRDLYEKYFGPKKQPHHGKHSHT